MPTKEDIVWQKLIRLNDDGWKTSAAASFVAAVAVLSTHSPRLWLFIGLLCGVLYQQFIEWYGHMLQHRAHSAVLRYFRVRHARHHRDQEAPHALQPLVAVVFAFPVILSPAVAAWFYFTYGPVADFSRGTIAGFLLAYGALSVLHYDLHTERHIVPAFMRRTIYYQVVAERHRRHHRVPRQYFCVSNPWMDNAMSWLSLDKAGVAVAAVIFAFVDGVVAHLRRLE